MRRGRFWSALIDICYWYLPTCLFSMPTWLIANKGFQKYISVWSDHHLSSLYLVWDMTCQFEIGYNSPVIDARPKSTIEKRKTNLIFFSPILRRERETWNSFPQFREEKREIWRRKKVLHFQEEKEKGIFFSQVSRGERWYFFRSLILRREREIWNSFPQFWEQKEKFGKGFTNIEKR